MSEVTVLYGHESEDTAYVVDDYPYGFRLRTKIRYWVETDERRGQRMVSQTLNPKNGRWNKPKTSTYSDLVFLGLDENEHVFNHGYGIIYSDEAARDKYVATLDKSKLTTYQQKQLRMFEAVLRTRKHIKVECVETTHWTPEQQKTHDEKQTEMKKKINTIANYYMHKVKEEQKWESITPAN